MKTLIIVFLVVAASSAFSQEVLSAAGEDFETSGVKVSWTLGEPVIETFSNGNNFLTQGFHQTKLIVTPVLNLSANGTIRVYPNPVRKFVFIEFENFGKSNAIAELFGSDGKLLIQAKIAKSRTGLDLFKYQNGSYLLKISSGNVILNTFKLIKSY